MVDSRGVILHDEEFLPAAFNLISWAKKTIFISSFKLEITTKPRGRNLARLFDLIAQKAADGVDVRILTNKHDNQGHVPSTNAYAILHLKKKKIKVRYLQNNRICHAKTIIVDSDMAILGSHNLSIKSCHNNFEISYTVSHSQMVATLESMFVKVWCDATDA